MKVTKNILLTFDYEPFLGKRTGSAQKCMIEPTNALLAILDKYNAKAIFFVDVLYLVNLKNVSELNEDYEIVKNQMTSLCKNGHYVFPHIHPHWMDASYLKEKGEFDLSNLSNYSLAKLDISKVKELFEKSIRFLNEIGISYSKYGYRAGGWCIQPFSSYKEIFLNNNIVFEFSVLPGYKNESETQAFDFSSVVKDSPYFFSNEVEIPDINGLFIEFPISTIPLNKLILFKDKLIRKYLWKKGDRGWGDGLSAHTAGLKTNLNNREMVSLDVLNIAKLGLYKKYIKAENYMQWISHPKMFTKHGLKNFDQFLKYSHSNFKIEYDFNNMFPDKN